MTKTVGSYEAKTHFSELMEEVQKGVEIIITKHGQPIARISSPTLDRQEAQKQAVQNMLDFMKRRQKEWKPGDITFEEALAWKHAGHRY